ncbi:Hypothetical predicted protein [Podarcis lilfordi]|uniref:Uncharacterized protein n=1 Tax=Podarcis lilfordi TaxID=74358 RepID=A0AA35L007_9SAUR|nr:Hypothetical predicted protein [Podarcis lilfordi]
MAAGPALQRTHQLSGTASPSLPSAAGSRGRAPEQLSPPLSLNPHWGRGSVGVPREVSCRTDASRQREGRSPAPLQAYSWSISEVGDALFNISIPADLSSTEHLPSASKRRIIRDNLLVP